MPSPPTDCRSDVSNLSLISLCGCGCLMRNAVSGAAPLRPLPRTSRKHFTNQVAANTRPKSTNDGLYPAIFHFVALPTRHCDESFCGARLINRQVGLRRSSPPGDFTGREPDASFSALSSGLTFVFKTASDGHPHNQLRAGCSIGDGDRRLHPSHCNVVTDVMVNKLIPCRIRTRVVVTWRCRLFTFSRVGPPSPPLASLPFSREV